MDMNAQICRKTLEALKKYTKEQQIEQALSFAQAEMDKVAELTKQLAESREEVKRLRQYEIENPYLQ